MSLDLVLEKLSGVHRSGDGWKAYCPAHQDMGPSLSINLGTGGKILLNCFAGCDFDRIREAAGLTMVDVSGDGTLSAPVARAEVPPEDLRLRHEAYSALIALLTLRDGDRVALENRGLRREAIEANGYRTVTFFDSCQAGAELLRRFGEDLYRVPGWEPVYGEARLRQRSGILIPVRDEQGNIRACQLRTPIEDRKYVWLSTPGAVSSGTPIHVPLVSRAAVAAGEPLVLTEGPLKADVSACLWNRPVIAVAGVQAWREILPFLERHKIQAMDLALDMDWREKPSVGQAYDKLEQALRDKGVRTRRLAWEGHKGLDDALAAGVEPRAEQAEVGRVRSADVRLRPAPSAEDPQVVLGESEGDAGGHGRGSSRHRWETVRVSKVQPREVDWLWPGWLPAGCLTVLDGDVGSGKSLLTCELAACASTGRPMPGGRPQAPVPVAFFSCEDDLAHTFRPRLEASGADLERVEFPLRLDTRLADLPAFPRDCGLLGQFIEDTGTGLVIIDPLFSYLDDTVDTIKDAHVRRAMSALAEVAASTRCPILGVRHLCKDGSKSALHRGMGSIAVAGQARSVWHFARDEARGEDARALFQVKNNLGPFQQALGIRIVPHGMAARIEWDGEVHSTPEAIGKAGKAQESDAAAWLLALLAEKGPQAPSVVVSMGAACGYSRATVYRAAQKAGVRIVGPRGPGAEWHPPVSRKAVED